MTYLDNAASTPLAPPVREVLLRATDEHFANPSSAHGLGAAAMRALEAARAQVAALLRANAAEITFTSGGTEANALAVLGAARGKHAVATAIEHPAVLRNLERLAAGGFAITLVPPEANGVVSPERVREAVRADTALVAVMLVNNELGTVQPVAQIARGLSAVGGRRPHLHVDAVQAAALMPIDVAALGADSLALSAHKLHGPKGVGALWLRTGARIAPLWDGGRQERGLRSGTENLPAIAAFGCAAELCRAARAEADRVAGLRDRLEALIFEALPEARPTVLGAARAPHIASVLIPYLPAEPILHALEARGVMAAAGSACASRTRGPSHVLAAIGVNDRAAVLRFSLSRFTTETDVQAAAQALPAAVAEIRPVAQRRAR